MTTKGLVSMSANTVARRIFSDAGQPLQHTSEDDAVQAIECAAGVIA